MDYTGERPHCDGEKGPVVQHIARYDFAKELCLNKDVLDLGCGIGYGSAHLAMNGARSVVGMDYSEELIRDVRKKYSHPRLNFLVANCNHLSVSNNSFDVVCSFELIEHLEDPTNYLSEIRRVLKSGGTAAISTPNKKISSPHMKPANPFHLKEYYLDEFERVLKKFFLNVDIYGQTIPIYESTILQKMINRIPRRLKHIIPKFVQHKGQAMVWKLAKPDLDFTDVLFTKEDIPRRRNFVALCQ